MLRADVIDAISNVMNSADIAAQIAARRHAYDYLPNRQQAADRLASDIARLRALHGERLVYEALRMATGPGEPRVIPMAKLSG